MGEEARREDATVRIWEREALRGAGLHGMADHLELLDDVDGGFAP